MIFRAEPIFEHDRGDAMRIQPVGDLHAFMVQCQTAVAASGANDDGGTVGIGRG